MTARAEIGTVLLGKVAVVSGGSKGIGRGLAIGLARHGAAGAVNYKNDGEGAEETARIIREAGGKAIVVQADVSVTSEAARMINEAVDRLGRIDILVNNAGRSRFNWALEITEGDWDDVVGTN